MIRQLVIVALAAAAAAILAAGCGMNTGSTGSSGSTAMQPVGPAAPPAARTAPVAPVVMEPRAHVAVFARAASALHDSDTLSFESVSLLDAKDKPFPLEIMTAAPSRSGAFCLVARGDVPAGKCHSLALQPRGGAHDNWLKMTANEPAIPLRMPRAIDLRLEPIELRADDWAILIVTLDLSGLRAGPEAALSARRFKAGPLPPGESGGLKGAVSPAASLARVYACWADTDTPIAMTQADPFSGGYSLTGLPPGQYRLRITAAGHEAYQGPAEPIALSAGATVSAPGVTLAANQAFNVL